MCTLNLSIWSVGNGQPTQRPVVDAVGLSGDLPAAANCSPTELQLSPTRSEADVVAAVLVPPIADRRARCNGIPMAAGVHLLQHRDRIDDNGDTLWVAESRHPKITEYDPERHGSDLRCFITKAPLQPGDEIVQCPGRPGVTCDILYLRASWDAVLDADPKFRCPQCGFDPSAPQWQPKLPATSSLNRFLERARKET